MEKETIIKWSNITIHTEKEKVNRYRCVRYRKIFFDVLVVTITDKGKTRFFAILAQNLPPEKGFIHFTYNSPTNIRWSPDSIIPHVKEFQHKRVRIIPRKKIISQTINQFE